MLASIARFTEDAAAIEKTLRLVQGLCTTAAALNESTDTAAAWLQARSQVNLGKVMADLLRTMDMLSIPRISY